MGLTRQFWWNHGATVRVEQRRGTMSLDNCCKRDEKWGGSWRGMWDPREYFVMAKMILGEGKWARKILFKALARGEKGQISF